MKKTNKQHIEQILVREKTLKCRCCEYKKIDCEKLSSFFMHIDIKLAYNNKKEPTCEVSS